MRILGLIVLLAAFPALGADPSTGLPQDPWAFPAKDFITTCDTSVFKAKLAAVDAESPSFISDVADVFARFAFCQGMVVGVSEMTQSNARLGLSKGGCRMETVSLQSIYATAAALYWKKPSEFDDVRASTLIFVALVEAYPCRANATP